MSAIELYDSMDLLSPSPTRDEYARGPPAKVTSAPAWLTVVLLVALAYLGTSNPLEPLFLGASAALALVAWYLSFYAKSYPKYTARNALDVDAYLGHRPGFLTSAYLAFMHRLTTNAISRETAESEGTSHKFQYGLPLKATASPHVEDLRVTSLDSSSSGDEDEDTIVLPTWPRSIGSNRLPKLPVIVGTIRMGFGHHRIAYSACSWALESGSPTYFHDLLGIESKEAQMIRDADKLYSMGSRMASELGGVVEALWGMITLAGSENSLRQTWQMAEGLIPLMMAMDKDIPVIASHSLVGMVAVACGFKTVVNCLIDNHAQWFVVVPGALNLVQGPGNLFKLKKLGVPGADIRVGGHWCPSDLVNNIEDDCADRIADLQAEAAGSPSPAGPGAARRTFLLPIGGAGAQRRFVIDLVRSVISSGLLEEGAQLVLNAGDHAHMKTAFEELLGQPGSPEYETLSTLEEVREAASDRHALKRRARVVLCAFDSYFPAVATTDIMCRAVDVLACKPSELAFYCVPKLMIRRVGDHEQFSAVRAYELGDGTREVREVEEALEWMRIMLEPGSDVLLEMNRRIAVNGTIGVYDGSKNAVEWAKKMAAGALD